MAPHQAGREATMNYESYGEAADKNRREVETMQQEKWRKPSQDKAS